MGFQGSGVVLRQAADCKNMTWPEFVCDTGSRHSAFGALGTGAGIRYNTADSGLVIS